MSRAFIKEDAGDPDELPERHQSAAPNYVTRQGLSALRRRVDDLRERLGPLPGDGRETRELRRDLRYFEGRLASAIVVKHETGSAQEARFGAIVELRREDGSALRVAIVGQDEAEASDGKVAWDSVLALALMGARKGDRIETEDTGALIVTDIHYP
ncbi:MAG TPA: transcription elongation factor [Elusimicrobia bacterium]|nr:transcription elongation factor [Elusimicrobiota bacterium]